MKKIYFAVASLLVSMSSFAQTNLGLETWADNFPTAWVDASIIPTLNGLTLSSAAISQGTTGATEGTSFARVETVTLSNSPVPTQIPNGPFAVPLSQEFNSTTTYENLSFSVRYNIAAGDLGVVVFNGLDADGEVIAQAIGEFTGEQAAFETETLTVDYTTNTPIASWEILVISSASQLFNINTTAVVGSFIEVDNFVLGSAINVMTPVTNVVASDISNNGNGTDLSVTFNVPANESVEVDRYYAVAMSPNLSPAVAVDPMAILNAVGIEITPNGASQTVNFEAADVYLGVANNQFTTNAIVNDVPMKVWIYAVGKPGYTDAYVGSNTITLTNSGVNVKNVNFNKFHAFPNPATDVLNFSSEFEIATINVISLDGKVVASSNGNSVNVSELTSGIYIYEAMTVDGQTATNKFVKK